MHPKEVAPFPGSCPVLSKKKASCGQHSSLCFPLGSCNVTCCLKTPATMGGFSIMVYTLKPGAKTNLFSLKFATCWVFCNSKKTSNKSYGRKETNYGSWAKWGSSFSGDPSENRQCFCEVDNTLCLWGHFVPALSCFSLLSHIPTEF